MLERFIHWIGKSRKKKCKQDEPRVDSPHYESQISDWT